VKPASLKEVKGCLQAIQSETTPVAGHGDPGAITDCWNSVNEFIEQLSTFRTAKYSKENHHAFIHAVAEYKTNGLSSPEVKKALGLGCDIFDYLLGIEKGQLPPDCANIKMEDQ